MSCRIPCMIAPRRRLGHVALFLVTPAVMLAACSDDIESPTASPTTPPALAAATAAPAFTQISSYNRSTCGITAAGRAYCWGSNEFGELGDSTSESTQAVPVPVVGNLVFRQVSVGFSHACGLTTEGWAYCWGDGSSGQLGTEVEIQPHEPVLVAGSRTYIRIAAGYASTCAIGKFDRRAYCWGANDRGQMGDGTTSEERMTPTPVAGTRTWHDLAVGGSFACGITTGDVAFCWGGDDVGQLGDGPVLSQRVRPTAVAGNHRFSQITAGFSHACAVTTDRKAYCWGFGRRGQIGDANTINRPVPTLVAGGLTVDRVSAASFNACAETAANRTYCWGDNGSGQVGNGTVGGFRFRPFEVAGGLRFSQVTVGSQHACGRTDTNVTYCWGSNIFGQLGSGTHIDHYVPEPVVGSR